MYDRDLVIEIFRQIHHACLVVMERFRPIRSVEDFTGSPAGMEKLDAICMQLIAIGESLKKVDTMTDGRLLPHYPAVDWKKAKGMRDILSHHYFDVNADAIYDVCETKKRKWRKASIGFFMIFRKRNPNNRCSQSYLRSRSLEHLAVPKLTSS